MPRKKLTSTLLLRAGLAVSGLAITANPASAQSVSINYDSLASLEEPLAFDAGDVTFNLTGLFDAALDLRNGDDDDFDASFLGNFQLNAETQLSNRWTVGVAYFGQYETDPGTIIDFGDSDNNYSNNIAGYVGGIWGTFIGGDATGTVRENTRRVRGAGNGMLAFDNAYGGLMDLGGAYIGRFGPVEISGTADEDGNFDIGAMWSRPIGNKDYRLTLRYTDGVFGSEDGLADFNSHAVGAVGELVYGSALFDLGFGYEELSYMGINLDRWYLSGGTRWKKGALTLSLEGHYGEIGSAHEVSAAFGARYDIARGLSLNLGVNYADAQVQAGGITLVDKDDEVQGIVSLRYGF